MSTVAGSSLNGWSVWQPSTTSQSPSLALSGLGSGIDTTSIVNQLMAIERIPEQKLQLQLSTEQARASALTAVKNELMTLQTDEQALQSPALWAPSQTVSTSDSSKISAQLLGGAGPGGYQVNVTQLALAAQRTYNYSPPTADDTLTIGSTQIVIAANSTIDQAVSAINSAQNSPVYAVSVNNNGTQQLVLASRQTGSANGFTASDTTGSISEVTSAAIAGQDAKYTINGGTQQTSSSNVVQNAIAGVQLTFTGLTSSGSVTVNVSNPGPNQSSIQSAIQAFVTQYNSTITDIQSRLAEQPVPNPQNATDAAKGVLYGDSGLQSLLDQLRESFSTTFVAGNPSGLQYLSQIGISTGAAVGSGGLNQNSISGQITFDTNAFAAALNQNSQAVKALIGGGAGANGFAQAFDGSLNPYLSVGGIFDQRVSGEGSTQSRISGQIADMNARLAIEQQTLQNQFAQMETLMQQSNAQGTWLAGQINSLMYASTPAKH